MRTIQEQQTRIHNLGFAGGLYAASATVITLTALTIITCGALCLTLPGVNVLSQVVYPVMCPCGGALFLTIPLIIASINRKNWQAVKIDTMLQSVKENFDTNLPDMLPVERRDYVVEILFPHRQNYISGKVWIDKMKKLYPDKPADMDKKIIAALDKAMQVIVDRAESKEWIEKVETAKKSIEKGTPIANALEKADDAWEEPEFRRALNDLIDYYPEGSPPVKMRALLQNHLDETYPEK